MDSTTAQELFLETPMSPMREPFSPLKLEHALSPAIIAVHDDHDEIVETIHDVVDDTQYPLQHHITDDHLDEAVELSDDTETDNDVIDDEDDSASLSSYSTPSTPVPALITLTPAHIAHLNNQFENMAPQDILRHCQVLIPNLYQTTAFGLSGLAILDMFSKLAPSSSASSPDLIFLDTLHHFSETLDLVNRVRERYSSTTKIHTFRPADCTDASEFAALHGSEKLWETDPERYDFLAKVEPQQRADRQLDVGGVVTGRRRSQGGERSALPFIEVVPSGSSSGSMTTVKINPLAKWSFEQVKQYVDENQVPYNALLDKGYRSVGDWHSTQPVKEGEGEREGRWKGQGKTECGIHNKKSRYAMFLMEMERKEREEQERKEKEMEMACEPMEIQVAPPQVTSEPTAAAASSTSHTSEMMESITPEALSLSLEKENKTHVAGAAAPTEVMEVQRTTATELQDEVKEGERKENNNMSPTPLAELPGSDVSDGRIGFQPWNKIYPSC